jgi:hypothetical protein
MGTVRWTRGPVAGRSALSTLAVAQ